VTVPIGATGRRALRLAKKRVEARRYTALQPAGTFEAHGSPLPLVQAAAAELAAEPAGAAAPSPAAPGQAPEAIEREMTSPSPEEVADRVYHLFCRELRGERERRGGWR